MLVKLAFWSAKKDHAKTAATCLRIRILHVEFCQVHSRGGILGE